MLLPLFGLATDGAWAKCAPTDPRYSKERHFYSKAKRNVKANYYAVEFHANYMTPGRSGPDYPAHISAETWVLMRNGSWVEVGIMNGWPWWPDNKQGPNPNVAYSFFWGDAAPGGCRQFVHTISNTVPDGSNHRFTIGYAGSKRWNVLLDDRVVGTSTVTQSRQPYAQHIGIELGEIDGRVCGEGSRADDMRMKPSTWKPGEGWRPWPSESSQIEVDAPSLKGSWHYKRGGQSEFAVAKASCW